MKTHATETPSQTTARLVGILWLWLPDLIE